MVNIVEQEITDFNVVSKLGKSDHLCLFTGFNMRDKDMQINANKQNYVQL